MFRTGACWRFSGIQSNGDKADARKWFDKAVVWTMEKDPTNVEPRQFWAEAAALLGQPGPKASDAGSPVTTAAVTPH
jgi:hypothetical protein